MFNCESEAPQSEDELKFLSSLQELRQLRSQIHNAADCCQTAFLQSLEKRTVIASTMKYICRAVVTVVDHLGGVSANLDSRLKEADRFSEADLRIDCLRQRLLVHEQHNQSDVLFKLRPSFAPPKHFCRYLSSSAMPNQEKQKEESREVESRSDSEISMSRMNEPKMGEDLPFFMYTSNSYKIPFYKSPSLSNVIPVQDGFSIPTETKMVAFSFQTTRKHGRKIMQWRSKHQNEILSLVRRRKEPLKMLKF